MYAINNKELCKPYECKISNTRRLSELFEGDWGERPEVLGIRTATPNINININININTKPQSTLILRSNHQHSDDEEEEEEK